KCFYSNLDFTYDVTGPEELATATARALEQGFSEARRSMAEKFFYIFFEKYCVKKTNRNIIELIRRALTYRFPAL
ncbi:MAG TPA: hypothetical protein DCX14_16035, partial [Flavobacteriales bacterium]|nr:hypothetical protein [Flavobacteriales bacterium]